MNKIEKSLTKTLNRQLRAARLPPSYCWFKCGAQSITVGNVFTPIAVTGRARRRLQGALPGLTAALKRTACAAGAAGLQFDYGGLE